MNVKTSLEMSKDISKPEQLITEHIDIWTSAILAKSTSGRGSNKKYELYGISKLRELILELAVHGKLVPQDANDETASVLLEKITTEKKRLINSKQFQKTSKLNPKNERFFPSGWVSVQVGDLCPSIVPNRDKPKSFTGNIPWVTLPSFPENGWELNIDKVELGLTKEEVELYTARLIPADSVLMSCVGRFGLTAINRVPVTSNQQVHAFIVLEGLLPEFLSIVIKNSTTELEKSSNSTTIPYLNKTKCESIQFGLPPLLEQHRIIAKVDELMLLCDQLEQQTEASIEAHAILVEVLLATLTDSTDSDELVQNWARIAEHFDSLFTTEKSIDVLKQTVLQLAVMGKLVPQNSDDEPASVLLEKIAEEKEQLVEDMKIKPRKVLPPIENEEKLFDLPLGWEWCRLDDICDGITSGSTPPKSSFIDETGIPYLKVYNIRNQKIDFEYQSQFIEESYHSSSLKRSQLCPGDVIMNIVGPPLGKIAIIPDTYPQWNCNQAIVMFRPFISDLNKFIYTYLVSGMFLDKIALIGTAGQDNISVTKSRSILLPTPPLAEQLRIVAKVDELMNICDQLKEKLQQSQETQVQLTDALVDRALG